jgi:hypothetical protein
MTGWYVWNIGNIWYIIGNKRYIGNIWYMGIKKGYPIGYP